MHFIVNGQFIKADYDRLSAVLKGDQQVIQRVSVVLHEKLLKLLVVVLCMVLVCGLVKFLQNREEDFVYFYPFFFVQMFNQS